jgi:cytochrome c-type biogenesis protein CcmH
MRDEPFAGRLAFWRAHPEQADGPALAAVLKAFAADRPSDPEPLRRLAAIVVSMGDPSGAAHALRQALTIAPGRPDLLEPLGEILVLENGGKVNADAEALFQQASLRDPSSPTLRYYRGRARIEAGDAQGGLALWKDLLAGLTAADPRRALLERDIDSVQKTGQPAPPADASPQPGAVSGAIQGMVDGLAARLRAHPDDPQGWVRLVRAYTVLGDLAKRDAALSRARTLFAGQPRILNALNAATARP